MNASMAFLSKIIRDGKMKTDPVTENEESETKGEVLHINIEIRNDIYENWLKGIFTKTITCIGFRPLPNDIAQKISRKYQLIK